MSQGIVMGKKDAKPIRKGRECLVALGSNLNFAGESPAAVLDAAIAALKSRGFAIRACSRYFDTPAFPAGAGPNFVNAVIAFDTALPATKILTHLHEVEAEMGRNRAVRWGARTLDLDIIAVGSHVLPDLQTYQYWCELPLEDQKNTAPQQLILPHPRLAERAFVLVPLIDVAPDWCHPVSKETVRQMHDALSDAQRDEVKVL
jgi:2-amino-4-hydroxy-6-hydroxymethyldihydropteridine diphosphokinase